jgi:uncharacterized protein
MPSLPASPEAPPSHYERLPSHHGLIREQDLMVPMRDRVRIAVDVYRPQTSEALPALLAFAIYNKDLMGPDMAAALPPQPAWAPLWTGCLETGDTRFLVSRGYVHVIGSPRGVGKSEGGGDRTWDSYDLIAWIAEQDWCDGQVGMVGISGFGAEQFHAAKQQPPALKAIFPFDPRGAYGTLGSFREEYPGGVLHFFRYLIGHMNAFHQNRGAPGALSPDRDALWQAAMANPDYRMYPHVWNVLTQKGQHMPAIFDLLIYPWDRAEAVAKAEADFARVTVPTYTGSGWYGAGYKTHLNGAQNWFTKISTAKKLLLAGPAHLERPWHGFHTEVLRWFDFWLKGIDTGVMDEAPVRYWVMGENAWRNGTDWPLPETVWEPLYLSGWERLRSEPFVPGSVDDHAPPDAFVQMPLSQTMQVQRLRYVSEPLPQDVLLAGPAVLTLFAAIDQPDTNWIVVLSDLGPDPTVRTARTGERDLSDMPEREVSRGWLKASMRALDETRSTAWKPWHKLTRDAQTPVPVGEVVEYKIELMAFANVFRAGHRIALDITALDVPTGIGGATNAEYIPNHLCSSRTVLHRIFHDTTRPSHLLLPVVSTGGQDSLRA